jgi:hypothetical protein
VTAAPPNPSSSESGPGGATPAHAARTRRRRQQARIGLNLTSMIDVVFLLLVYFMAATEFKLGEEIYRLDLPRRGAPADPFVLPRDPLHIVLASTGPVCRIRLPGPYAQPAGFQELHGFLVENLRTSGAIRSSSSRPGPRGGSTRWRRSMRPSGPDTQTSRLPRRPEARVVGAVFALLLAASASVVAQPDLVAGDLETIATERSRAVDPRVPAADRLASAERLLDLRGRVLAERPDDPRRAVWLADQATDLLFVLLPINSSGLTSLFGLPSPDQRARAERVGRQMSALAAEAELEIERSILALESAPGYADDIAARMKRRRLTEGERDRRIPFLRGVGACLAAALDRCAPEKKEAAYRLAAERLQTALPLLTGRPADLARLYAGLALRGLGDYEAADAVLDAPAPAPRANPADVFAIRMAQVTISAARAGPTAGLDALSAMEKSYLHADDLFFRVLIADQRFLLHRDAARQADGSPRQRHLVQAYEALLDLLDARPGPEARAIRVIVLDRLIRAVDADAPLDQLPEIVSVARARQLGAQPDTRAQAIALFNRLLERGDLATAARAEALYGLAQALLADEQLHAAAQRFGQLARDHPTARTAERAVVLAATIAAELYRRVPGCGPRWTCCWIGTRT